jgi:hypothetical protein
VNRKIGSTKKIFLVLFISFINRKIIVTFLLIMNQLLKPLDQRTGLLVRFGPGGPEMVIVLGSVAPPTNIGVSHLPKDLKTGTIRQTRKYSLWKKKKIKGSVS